MEKSTGEDIQKAKKDLYNRASLGNTRLKQKNMSESRCIGLCNRRSVVNKVQGWKMEASSLYL